MAFELDRDARRLRVGLLLSALALLGMGALVAVQALEPAWLGYQAAQAPDPAGRSGILQQSTCAGGLDRCETCHMSIRRNDPKARGLAQPRSAHPDDGVVAHRRPELACSLCHGGTGRALTVEGAHAQPGHVGRDPLMKGPHRQAACARCHLPGSVAGTESLARGAQIYLELGCPVCHPLGSGGLGGADFGPDLRAIGRRSPAYLKTSLLDPAANFSGSTMPAFTRTFDGRPGPLRDLLIDLMGLALERVDSCADVERSSALARAPCATCHAGPAGRAQGRLQHRDFGQRRR